MIEGVGNKKSRFVIIGAHLNPEYTVDIALRIMVFPAGKSTRYVSKCQQQDFIGEKIDCFQ